MVERSIVETVQLRAFNDPNDNRGYGEGSMEDALIRFRQNVALRLFGQFQGQEKVLDLGCGRGEVVDTLTCAGVLAYGVDFAPQRVIDTARKMSGNFLIARVQELPFPNDTFLGATAFEIFEHLSPKEAGTMLSETLRVLAPGSLLALSTPNEFSIGGRIRKFVGSTASVREDHFNQVDYQRLLEILKEYKFEIVNLYGVGLFPGLWMFQKYFPSSRIHDFNIKSAASFPQFASASLVIARKPQTE